MVRRLLFCIAVSCGCRAGIDRPTHDPPARRANDGGTPERTMFVAPGGIPIRWEGRIAEDDPDAPRFAWPASGFRFRFHGTGATARLRDVLLEDEIRDADLLAVYVDGGAPVTVPLTEGTLDVPLARHLVPGEHEIRVLKRTESEQGTITLLGIALEGRRARFASAPAAKPRRLLAIGDSITAGYGIDGPNAQCHFSAGTANATRTYAFFAAEALSAEYEAIAWSGRGVYRNLRESIPETIPILYERRLAAEESPRFDPRAFVPDFVVIDAGTNDLNLPHFDRARFYSAYRALVAQVRQDAPDAQIVLAVGPMLADDYPPGSRALTKARRAVMGVVAERRAHGDRRISYLEFTGAMPEEGYACDFHPSLATHRRMAAVLVDHLRATE